MLLMCVLQGYVIAEDYFAKNELEPLGDSVKKHVGDFASHMYNHGTRIS